MISALVVRCLDGTCKMTLKPMRHVLSKKGSSKSCAEKTCLQSCANGKCTSILVLICKGSLLCKHHEISKLLRTGYVLKGKGYM